jgi:hypothetical protein
MRARTRGTLGDLPALRLIAATAARARVTGTVGHSPVSEVGEVSGLRMCLPFLYLFSLSFMDGKGRRRAYTRVGEKEHISGSLTSLTPLIGLATAAGGSEHDGDAMQRICALFIGLPTATQRRGCGMSFGNRDIGSPVNGLALAGYLPQPV